MRHKRWSVSRKLPLAEGETSRTACARTVLRCAVDEETGDLLSPARANGHLPKNAFALEDVPRAARMLQRRLARLSTATSIRPDANNC
ncbi:hypothetical protein GCM10020367_06220 [Streptomyces sannanensis]|uniref:Transposase n=1 Tax=Streptomyces sannanensis TaxID=285536 RepID=A0ABP6S533_9ACTN